jgi:hypothetical protein
MIRQWRTPIVLQNAAPLRLDGLLRAEVVIHGSVVASADVVLRSGRLHDIPLIDHPLTP